MVVQGIRLHYGKSQDDLYIRVIVMAVIKIAPSMEVCRKCFTDLKMLHYGAAYETCSLFKPSISLEFISFSDENVLISLSYQENFVLFLFNAFIRLKQ